MNGDPCEVRGRDWAGGLGDMSPSLKAATCRRTPHGGDFWAGRGNGDYGVVLVVVGDVELIGLEVFYGLHKGHGSGLVGIVRRG